MTIFFIYTKIISTFAEIFLKNGKIIYAKKND